VAIKEEGGFLQFEVKDNGVGIPASEQGKLFERFFRGSNVSKLDPGGGTGLGLYIAKAIIEQSGGKIWFDSKENEGTTFFATFPY
jgi:Signal transduction histidine kinase